MFPIKTLFILLSASIVVAQYGYGGSSDSSSTSSSAAASTLTPSTFTSTSGVKTHIITVGDNNNIVFSPNTLTAAVGDALEFQFFPATHSVNQATFDKPCQPANGTGFSSGAVTTSSGQNANIFTVLVNDTSPIWFYCGFPGHCQAGMTGVVNAPSDGSQTLDAFNKAAASVGKSSTVSSAQGGVIGAAASSSGASASPSATAKPGAANTLGGWTGATIGLVVVVFAALII